MQKQMIVLLIVQISFFVIFFVYAKYDDHLLPVNKSDTKQIDNKESSYAHFQDVHVMIFVGFGFLMTFLKKYSYSAVGFNLVVSALVIQWALIIRGLFVYKDNYIRLSLDDIIGADIAAAVILISMGALLGRTSPLQLMFMGLIEIVVFAANEYFQLELMKITDAGGSIIVHAFGAYFGLAVSLVLGANDKTNSNQLEGSSYTSDIFAMIGTLFLWMFWPSFNSVLLSGAARETAILNTYLALAASTVTTFVISALVTREHKLDMVHMQNSSLAGGVAVGSVCNLLIGPHGAILIGIIAGLISVLGFRYLTPAITSKLGIRDTCGVHNLHGMPAIISAIFSAIYALSGNEQNYKDSLTEIFPAMIDVNSTTDSNEHEFIIGGYGRTAAAQGLYQLLGVAITLVIAILSGIVTGFMLKYAVPDKLSKKHHYDDEIHWEIPTMEI